MAGVLGIYFGLKVISVVESDGKKVVKSFQVPVYKEAIPSGEEKVPEEIKIATILKDEFRKNEIQAKEANITIAGKDLIIRAFNMAALAPSELANAVKFEAKKYTPFKVDEMISDFQSTFDRSNKNNLILFAGIKKDVLDRHLFVLKHLGISVNSVEYAGFSTLRLLNLAGVKESGVVAVVNVDLIDEDEINFLVLENGFPLFSRDIILSGPESSSISEKSNKASFAESLEKLKIELRISLDFYLRKFPTKNIKKVILLAPEESTVSLEGFVKERGLIPIFLNLKKFIDKPISYSLSFYKAYSVSIAKVLKSTVKIELSPEKQSQKASRGGGGMGGLSLPANISAEDFFHFDIKFIALSIAICGGVFAWGYYKIKPLQQELASVKTQRPQVKTVDPETPNQELSNKAAEYEDRLKILDALVRKRLLLTKPLDLIPRIIPEGLWLSDFSFHKAENKDVELNIQGIAYLNDADKELEAVNKFLANMQATPELNKYFNEMSITSVSQGEEFGQKITNFVLFCKGKGAK